MKTSAKIPRREFIRISAISGTFLAIGCMPSTSRDNKKTTLVNLNLDGHPGTSLNQYVFINEEGIVTLYNHRPEMGQGTFQSIPMILAEELEVDMNQVNIQQSPADSEKYGWQMVVGSHSIKSSYDTLRKMGAAAREMLITAAAAKWVVSESECIARNAEVIHQPSNKKLTYGELVAEASKLPVPENPKLKKKKDFNIIGRDFLRREIPIKTSGEAKFGIDITVPGMLYASVANSPNFSDNLISYDATKTKTIKGVKHVTEIKRNVYGRTVSAVAVVADNYWSAYKGKQALEIKWDSKPFEDHSTETIFVNYDKASSQDGTTFKNDGNFKKAFPQSIQKIEAAYETPYQVHVPMEPLNAIVSVEQSKCEFWGSTQNPNGIRSFLSEKYGVPPENVRINYTFMGGGFGRRSMLDIVEQAAELSHQTGAPVKLIWNREDEISQGPFRACSFNVCKGALDDLGNLHAFEHKIVCQDIRNQTGESMEANAGIMGGVVTEYEVPNYRISGVLQKHFVPISYWRSVYHSTNCFAHESFIDEMAHLSGKDPIEFRLSMLKNHRRYTKVLETIAEKSDWYGLKEDNAGKGIAIVERSGAFVAMVVEVSRIEGKVKPVKVITVVDCGICIHPNNILAQTEGSVVMALTAAYKSAITIKEGKVVQHNFDDYQMLKLDECPVIVTHIIDSEDPPEGAGETGLPTLAPALTNAIFDLTGKRIRKLPFELDEV